MAFISTPALTDRLASPYGSQVGESTAEAAVWSEMDYLALLGVSPGYQRQGIGGALLTPVLQRADREGAACYLGTFVADNVPFYERRGFQVVEAGVEPTSVVAFWAMKRKPHAGRE